ncbi:ribokinase [Kineococcus gynurae]|uniref:Ribokinase n=1 Tax=Kineococcus gynurae TaxID=452979 RepID=A0ABV5LP04_9ACTN
MDGTERDPEVGAGLHRDSHGRLHAEHVRDVCVVGSINVDLVLELEALPVAGTTTHTAGGVDLARGLGGKGANQAVACARLGRRTAMVGLVGEDDEGERLLAGLRAEALDVSGVGRVPGPSGVAVVLVHDGESTIVVSPGANGRLGAEEVGAATATVAGARVVLLQCEVADEALLAAARLCTGLLVLNPAPARPLPDELLRRADLLVPNTAELAVLAGRDAASGAGAGVEELVGLARTVRPTGTTIVTRGAAGALVVTPGGAVEVEAVAPPGGVVDATAAGDSFVAGLVDGLLAGSGLVEAAGRAARVAAWTVGHAGAAASLPTREDLLDLRPAGSRGEDRA